MVTMRDDTDTIRALHERFVHANTCEDVLWLEANTMPDVNWFNLNKSNYRDRAHILALWRSLHEARPATAPDATLEVSELRITVTADAAWATYLLSVDYDFGELSKTHLTKLDARTTEIWRRTDGGWKLAHFHCSEHVAGVMAGD